jgi:peroxiredoxin
MEENTAKALSGLTVLDTAGQVVRLGDLWRETPAALVFVRHFGCMLCKEQVAELGGFAEQFAAAGLRLFLIGNGSAAQAAAFAKESATPFPLYTDSRLGTFKAAGLTRGIGSVVNIGTLKSGLRAMKAGHFQSATKGDAWQEGGAFVIAPGDRLLFAQRSKAGGDHVDPRELIRAIGG